jgi:ABC-type antimicrobial peptide transport system permease subunit
MFFAETSIISFVFGGTGILTGIAAVNIVRLFHITTENRILELLFGGNVFRPTLGSGDILVGIIELAMVTFLAVIYPLRVARKITPLDAIMRD